MEPTKLLYLEDFTSLQFQAKVVAIEKDEQSQWVVLDQTIFYPQGGGQPYDQGVITSSSGKFNVTQVRFVDGIVRHIGEFEQGSFNIGDEVEGSVDKERRELNSKLHSAGHLVDMTVQKLNLGWVPGKGFHFPEGPYVEYSGSLDGVDTEKLKTDIEEAGNELIKEGRQTRVEFVEKDRMKELCDFVPDYILAGKPARVVLFGDFGVPCGGTHVNNISELGGLIIRKIKGNGENVIRVAYDIPR